MTAATTSGAAARGAGEAEPARPATNGIKFTELERQRLKSIRYQPADQPIAKEVTAA